jgi:sulfite exporter TauE/SafE
MIASIACFAFGSLLVAFFTIDIGLVLKERHIWPSSRLSERLIRAFFWDLAGGFWVAAGLDFWRVRPVRAVIRLTAGVAIIAGLYASRLGKSGIL